MSCHANMHERMEDQHFLLIIMNMIGVFSDIWVASYYIADVYDRR